VARETPSIFAMFGGRDALVPELAGFGGIGVVDLAGPTELGATAFALERDVQRGALSAGKPFLNPA